MGTSISNRLSLPLGLIAALFLSSSCNYRISKEPASATGTTLSTEPLSFAILKREVLQENCFSCHGITPNIRRFGDYKQIMKLVVPGNPEASRLFQVLSRDDRKPMPKDFPLPDDQIAYVYRWIAAGAPETVDVKPDPSPSPSPRPSPSPSPSPSATPDPSASPSPSPSASPTPTEPELFELVRRDVLPACINCHDNWEDNKQAILNTMDEHGVPVVIPGDPDRSAFYTKVRDDLMPKGEENPKLDALEKAKIYNWIKSLVR